MWTSEKPRYTSDSNVSLRSPSSPYAVIEIGVATAIGYIELSVTPRSDDLECELELFIDLKSRMSMYEGSGWEDVVTNRTNNCRAAVQSDKMHMRLY
jgi:hypothetical protein